MSTPHFGSGMKLGSSSCFLEDLKLSKSSLLLSGSGLELTDLNNEWKYSELLKMIFKPAWSATHLIIVQSLSWYPSLWHSTVNYVDVVRPGWRLSPSVCCECWGEWGNICVGRENCGEHLSKHKHTQPALVIHIIDTVGVPKSTLVSKWVGDVCENLLLFYWPSSSHHPAII